MRMDRQGSGQISGWQAAVVLIPLLGVAVLGVAGLLVYFAMHGRWGAFGVISGCQLGGLAMFVGVLRRSGGQNDPHPQG